MPTSIPRTSETTLAAVSADSATHAWASGSYYLPGGPGGPMMLHRDGNAWKLVKNPTIANTPVESGLLSAISPTHVWAAVAYPPTSGDELIVHWDGKTWTQVSPQV